MDVKVLAVVAGSASTTLFVVSYLPMLVRAIRTRDLRSYSRSSLVIANVGNVVQTCYVVSLPVGPLWFLHGFYLVSSAVMLLLHVRHRAPGGKDGGPRRVPIPRNGAEDGDLRRQNATPGATQPGSRPIMHKRSTS